MVKGLDRIGGTYFCTPTRPSLFLKPCTNAGMASRAVVLRVGDALIVVCVVMSYSPHWRWPPGSVGLGAWR